jgi:hypothetical protein
MPTASHFIIPPFPGLLEEMDVVELARTQPETREEWIAFKTFNKSKFASQDALSDWAALVASYSGVPSRVVFSTGFHHLLDRPIYAVRLNEYSVVLPYPGILRHFYFRAQTALVKNGIPLPVVQSHLFAFAKAENSYRPRWQLGYETATGNIAVVDSGQDIYAAYNYLVGLPIPLPVIKS